MNVAVDISPPRSYSGLSGLFRGLIWNITIPDSLRGRVAGIELMSAGVRGSGLSGGILCIAAAGVLTLLLRVFWRYDVREWRAAHPEAGADPVVHGDAGRITPDPASHR